MKVIFIAKLIWGLTDLGVFPGEVPLISHI